VHAKESIEATCPDCRGPLSLIKTDDLVEVRCLMGHAYSARTLLQAHAEAQEKALWAAAVALRETATLVSLGSAAFSPSELERLRAQIEKKQQQAARVQGIIEDLDLFEV
jgi:two-component system chemotaxis response regulator CheB